MSDHLKSLILDVTLEQSWYLSVCRICKYVHVNFNAKYVNTWAREFANTCLKTRLLSYLHPNRGIMYAWIECCIVLFLSLSVQIQFGTYTKEAYSFQFTFLVFYISHCRCMCSCRWSLWQSSCAFSSRSDRVWQTDTVCSKRKRKERKKAKWQTVILRCTFMSTLPR